MSDVFTKEKRSDVMSRIKGKGNKDTELAIILILRRRSHFRMAKKSGMFSET